MPSLDETALVRRATHVARRLDATAVIGDLERLHGGISSLTFSARLAGSGGDRPIVLKVAPPGLAPTHNRDVLRQARLVRRLGERGGVPVPEILLEDDGVGAGLPPFYAMSLVPGEAYEVTVDVIADPPSPETGAERMRVSTSTLARLHALPVDVLTGGSAEPVLGPADELARWRRLVATVGPGLVDGHEELHARLSVDVPEPVAPRVLHGDYRLANMLFTDTQLRAVIDWEIWSVGDPRTDLAWVLMYLRPAHAFHESRPDADVAAGSALPAAEDLVATYAEGRRAAGEDAGTVASAVDRLPWFVALAYYKTACTVAAICKRDRRSEHPDPHLTVAAGRLGDVLAAGHRALDEG